MKFLSDSRALLLCGAAVGSLMICAPAFAQTAAPVQLEEIVVTSQRTESNLQRTPIAVTALTGATLQQRGATSLIDIAAYTPNLSIGTRSGQGAAAGGFTIRGMGVDATGSSAAVGVYLDDVYFPASFGNLLGLFDVDRVEVLRGPQGTLFGRNTIAGAVQYISAKPNHTQSAFIDVTGGSYGRADIQAAVNAPIGDQLAVRAAVGSTSRDGFVTDQLNNVKRGDDRTTQSRVQARWTPTDRLTVDLKVEGVRQRTNGRAIAVTGVNPNAAFPVLAQFLSVPQPFRSFLAESRPLDARYISRDDYKFAGFNGPESFKFDYREGQAIEAYKLTDTITVKSISAYSWSRSRILADIDNTPLAILASDRGDTTNKTFTQEFQAVGRSFEDRLNWTVGFYYYDGEEKNRNSTIQIGYSPPVNLLGDTDINTTSKAVYGQATYKLTDKLSATLGLRYSQEDTDGKASGFGALKTSFDDTSPHVGLNYQLTEDALLYGKVTKGFRAGGYSFSSSLPNGAIAFGPETAWTYEAGARLQFLNRRLRVNPTVFYTDWKAIQFNALVFVPGGVIPATRNAGDARITGAELETQFAVTERLLLTGSASLLDGKYKTVSPVVALTTSSDLQQSPKFKYAVGARYTHPLAGGAKLAGNVDWSWTDKQRSGVTDPDFVELPSYGLLSARVQYIAPDNRWSVALFGTNLTDEYYYVGGVDFAKGGTTGTTEVDLGRPREWGVNLRASF